MKKNWNQDDIPDLKDKTILITGANSGLGLESAIQLSRKNAHIIFACRSKEKALKEIENIKNDNPNAKLSFYEIDLMDLESIDQFVEKVIEDFKSIDVLLNNAGIMAIPRRQTKNGFEAQFGTNHLGHFYLTGKLLKLLDKSKSPRIVNVSSVAHTFGFMNWKDINHQNFYFKWKVYGMTKLANLLFTQGLIQRLDSKYTILSAHPGWTKTNLQIRGPEMQGNSLLLWGTKFVNNLCGQDVSIGALPQIYACIADDVINGDFIGPDGFMNMRGYPIKTRALKKAYDKDSSEKLWDISSELTNFNYPS